MAERCHAKSKTYVGKREGHKQRLKHAMPSLGHMWVRGRVTNNGWKMPNKNTWLKNAKSRLEDADATKSYQMFWKSIQINK